MPFRDRAVRRRNRPVQRVRSNTSYRNTSFDNPTKAVSRVDPGAAPSYHHAAGAFAPLAEWAARKGDANAPDAQIPARLGRYEITRELNAEVRASATEGKLDETAQGDVELAAEMKVRAKPADDAL